MNQELFIYDSLTREYVRFEPLHEGRVGLYVCGPTVYSDVHQGNCRTFVSFDIIYRYLRQLGYEVRYLRNITDVGHLEGDADEGEDKVYKKARLEHLEPMEVVQRYMNGFHEMKRQLDHMGIPLNPNFIPKSLNPEENRDGLMRYLSYTMGIRRIIFNNDHFDKLN